MSLEFTVYAAISLAALMGALAAYAALGPKYGSAVSGAELETFVSIVDANMQYTASSFEAFVPKGMCNSVNASGKGMFDSPLAISSSVCGGAGGIEALSMSRLGNGTFALWVSK